MHYNINISKLYVNALKLSPVYKYVENRHFIHTCVKMY